ncbi:TPA: hypothetical protein ACVU30_003863 [Vibrio parahaemolyticus]|uniref:hypothetical protein n=1 Tax=Vibrio harveyi group TaxID=717610 RepID=UPI0015DC736B|nr:hypothetical protein [Vibrio parahaemolyticus]QLK45805.1 hypothetical protein DR996_11520 [Vibrio owensii]EJE4150068.1 hypothetical protein [Vibrio parahaemolyticus]MBE4173540.1 hypothetical protein [Vibrio parahaemolyticus]MBY7719233.1 hypothetical protein [Vibrio parahaemolyticus]MCR9758538.1 hypothetical protein [Vibrio parahaemolyticus]
MKELMSALSQEAVNRLKLPILGAFILSWLAVNHSIVLTFWFSSSAQKLLLLQQDTSFWELQPTVLSSPPLMMIVYPVLFSLFYMFGIPLVQHYIDAAKFTFIDSKRIKKKHEAEQFIYESQINSSRAKAKSKTEYWSELLSRELDSWDEERTKLNTELTNISEHRDSLQSQLNSSNKTQSMLSDDLEKLRQEIHQVTMDKNDQESKMTKKINALEIENIDAASTISGLEESLQNALTYKQSLEDAHKLLTTRTEQIDLITTREKEALKAVEGILIAAEEFIQFFDKESFLHYATSDFEAAYEKDIAPAFRAAIQPLKTLVGKERELINKGRLKAELEIKVATTESEIKAWKENLKELEGKADGLKLWE